FCPAVVALALSCYAFKKRPGLAALRSGLPRRTVTLLAAVVLGALVIWAGYRFSYGKVDFASLRLPAPELYRGIQEVRAHNTAGHPSYLLGDISPNGFWLFYPVTIGVKTPIPYLILLAAGLGLLLRKESPVAA